jgi:hypothetical protein
MKYLYLKPKYLYITNEIPAFKSSASPDMKKSASVLRAAKRNTSSKNKIPELRPEKPSGPILHLSDFTKAENLSVFTRAEN